MEILLKENLLLFDLILILSENELLYLEHEVFPILFFIRNSTGYFLVKQIDEFILLENAQLFIYSDLSHFLNLFPFIFKI
jgi:hypothetical protein